MHNKASCHQAAKKDVSTRVTSCCNRDTGLSMNGMANGTDAPKACSPWGAIAAYFLVQCFGFVAIQGFRMFTNIAANGSDDLNSVFNVQRQEDRIFLAVWGLSWIVTFVIFESVILHYISMSLKEDGPLALVIGLKKPTEILKLAVAVVMGIEYVRFLLGHYPFPSRPISLWTSTAFGVLGFVVPALFVPIVHLLKRLLNRLKLNAAITASQQQNQVGAAGAAGICVGGILFGAMFLMFAVSLKPGLFYFHGLLGLFVIMLFGCLLLFLPEGLKNGNVGRAAADDLAVRGTTDTRKRNRH